MSLATAVRLVFVLGLSTSAGLGCAAAPATGGHEEPGATIEQTPRGLDRATQAQADEALATEQATGHAGEAGEHPEGAGANATPGGEVITFDGMDADPAEPDIVRAAPKRQPMERFRLFGEGTSPPS